MGGHADHQSEDANLTLATEMLRSFGEVRSVVRGASMVPTLFPGDVLVVHPENAQTARQGDVIVFFRYGLFCAHRLMNKTHEGDSTLLIARGDALSRNDPPFEENEVLGRVTAVIRRGKRIALDSARRAPSQRLLHWMVRRSEGTVKWLLRWHSLNTRFSRSSVATSDQNRWQLEGRA